MKAPAKTHALQNVTSLAPAVKLTRENLDMFCYAVKKGYLIKLRAKTPVREDVRPGVAYETELHDHGEQVHLAIIDDTKDASCVHPDTFEEEGWEVLTDSSFPSEADFAKAMNLESYERSNEVYQRYCQGNRFEPGDPVVQKKGLELFAATRIEPVIIFMGDLRTDEGSHIPSGSEDNGVIHDCRVMVINRRSQRAHIVHACKAMLEPFKK
jgi:hypothetical protein